jgi:hypothetical protein
MAALVVACMVSVFSLFTERREREVIIGHTLRRYRKPVLYVFTALTLIFGAWQIWRADKDSRDADKKHAAEREVDGKQISSLQSGIATLGQVNETQYQRNRDELHGLRDEILQLKLGKLTEQDRQKIADLEARLDKALAPKPKAVLDFGFFYPHLKQGEIRKDLYVTSNDNFIHLPFQVANVSGVNAAGLTIWVRICDICKFHSEPVSSIKPMNSPESDRLYKWPELQPGISVDEIVVDVDLPREITKAAVSFQYRCADCVVDESWKTLWVDVGQLPLPKFSKTAPTSKMPVKP